MGEARHPGDARTFIAAALINLANADEARATLPFELMRAVGDNIHQAQRLLEQAGSFILRGRVDWQAL